MRTIRRTKQFKKDYKRERAGHGAPLDRDLRRIIALLVADERLPDRAHDHRLSGEWNDHRDCHIRPDLVLIYRKLDEDSVDLVRLGSHSELGL